MSASLLLLSAGMQAWAVDLLAIAVAKLSCSLLSAARCLLCAVQGCLDTEHIF